MTRDEKYFMMMEHSIMIKKTGEYKPYRIATEYEQKNGLSDGIYLPIKECLIFGGTIGYIIDRRDRHNVKTYRAHKKDDSHFIIDRSTGKSNNPKNYISFEDHWSLHELILITDLICDKDVNPEKARLLNRWGTNSPRYIQINHMNKDKHTRDLDNLEICTSSENRIHRDHYQTICRAIKELEEAGLLKGTRFRNLSVKTYVDTRKIRNARDRALRRGDGNIFLQECRAQGITI